jgi:DNA-directed RNA polymerase II subunit RPB2
VLNFSLLSKVSKKTPTIMIRRVIEDCKTITLTKDINLKHIKNYSSVFLNNIIIGFTQDPDSTLEEVRNLRKIGIIDNEVSVSYDIVDNDVKIFCDEGRFIRPLFTLTDNKLNIQPQEKYKWKSLIKKGLIQYVDASEIENSVIAMIPEMLEVQYNNYCEIHPCAMLGIAASMIPFSDHSQSPRNCYQSSMSKQALGMPLLSYNVRADTVLHVLHYPQKPLVHTKAAEIFGFNDMPSGINAIVAIACYSGFNQEDSVMLNFSAVQRGMFCLTSYHTIDCFEKKRDTYSFEEICMPPPSSDHSVKEGSKEYFKRKNANYSLLDDNGIVRTRTLKGQPIVVKKGDVIIGKVVNTGNKNGEETKVDASVVIDAGEEGVIDKVITTITPNGYKLVKVVIRVYRSPTLGDKLASRSAQKGTIGMMYKQEDMPFTASGVVPDIIINPCCIPSRMTINQLIECALGKECTMTGEYADATPFTQNSLNIADKIVERANNSIEKYGFQSQGWETMYNGMTGEMMEAKIFIGPTYYQRLKHMVDDKMHARAKGHVTMLTRQPLEGRAKDGGLRFGEMERDAMISHGATRFLKERLFDVSDPFQVSLCEKCGIATNNTKECQSCKGNDVKSCNLAYASKLLTQELTALGLKVSMFPDDN